MTRPAGKMTCILLLGVLYASAIKEYRRENTILFQTLVRGAVIMIRLTISATRRGTTPLPVFQELVTGEILAGWTELRLSSLTLVVFASMRPGGLP